MSKKQVLRIELSPAAKQRLGKLSDQAGMTQIALMSRLVEWMMHQEETIQAAVLGAYPKEISAEVARLLLKRMQSR